MSEVPVVFASGTDDLFGIVRIPDREPQGVGVIILVGGRYAASSGRNRIALRLGDRLAEDGYHTLRFDYHGVGDSTGTVDEFHLKRPFLDDVRGAVSALREFGVGRYVLIGDCFGARTALEAIDGTEGVAGLILVSLPMRDFARGEGSAVRLAERQSVAGYARKALDLETLRSLRDPKVRAIYRGLARTKVRQMSRSMRFGSGIEPWLSRRVLHLFEQAADADLPVLLLYGTEEKDYDDFEIARDGVLSDLLASAETISVETVPGHIHSFRSVDVQELFIETTARWLRVDARARLGAP